MTRSRPPGFRALVVGLLGTVVLAGGVTYARWSTADEDDDRTASGRSAVTTAAATVEGELAPGGAVTGSVVVGHGSTRAVRVASARFESATTTRRGCDGSDVVFALTVEPSAATPLLLPPGAATSLGWTAFMTLDAQDACQGARFTSALVLDGRRVGSAAAVADSLPAPGQPVGGRTTPVRAAVRWPAVPGVSAYLLERALSGTKDWVPACRSAQAPLVTTSCTDTGLEPQTAYAYRATSVRGAWRAVGRLSADVTTQPLAR